MYHTQYIIYLCIVNIPTHCYLPTQNPPAFIRQLEGRALDRRPGLSQCIGVGGTTGKTEEVDEGFRFKGSVDELGGLICDFCGDFLDSFVVLSNKFNRRFGRKKDGPPKSGV